MSWVSSSEIRSKFANLMSKMYQNEVPLYGDLIELVTDVNNVTLDQPSELKKLLEQTNQLQRLNEERHGAIRLGKPEELNIIRRVFRVMGMSPVGYYDLVPAGVPVHATAFRATEIDDLNQSPFRIFTSLLRLELIQDSTLRETAAKILEKRQIFTPRAIQLLEKFEQQNGLDAKDADEFILEVLETFRWHTEAPVSKELYQALHDQHRLIADVVAFKGPHINHLTPRTLDIDTVQSEMLRKGISAKAIIEGPPRRKCPILLRQTSFKALNEKVAFTSEAGSHTARFGEIEQRGVALTPKGRALYDTLLSKARERLGKAPDDANAAEYTRILEEEFVKFPDNYVDLYKEKLAYFNFIPAKPLHSAANINDLETLIENGSILIEPIVYEDFLPVSAAGIFQSNLGDAGQNQYHQNSNQKLFEQSLGTPVLDEMQLYEKTQRESLASCFK